MQNNIEKEDNKFRKEERLCSPITISNLFREGKTISKFPFRIIYRIVEDADFLSKVVISVPKRNFKRAVKRNFFKRRMREAFRLNKHIIYNPLKARGLSLEFVVIYNTTEKLDYKAIEVNFCAALQILAERIERFAIKSPV